MLKSAHAHSFSCNHNNEVLKHYHGKQCSNRRASTPLRRENFASWTFCDALAWCPRARARQHVATTSPEFLTGLFGVLRLDIVANWCENKTWSTVNLRMCAFILCIKFIRFTNYEAITLIWNNMRYILIHIFTSHHILRYYDKFLKLGVYTSIEEMNVSDSYLSYYLFDLLMQSSTYPLMLEYWFSEFILGVITSNMPPGKPISAEFLQWILTFKMWLDLYSPKKDRCYKLNKRKGANKLEFIYVSV